MEILSQQSPSELAILPEEGKAVPRRDYKFWGVFLAITVSAFTGALDLVSQQGFLRQISDMIQTDSSIHGTPPDFQRTPWISICLGWLSVCLVLHSIPPNEWRFSRSMSHL